MLLYTSFVRQIPERNLQGIRENLFPVVKSEMQIREKLFLRNTSQTNNNNNNNNNNNSIYHLILRKLTYLKYMIKCALQKYYN